MIVNLLLIQSMSNTLNFKNEHGVINCENIENFALPQHPCS